MKLVKEGEDAIFSGIYLIPIAVTVCLSVPEIFFIFCDNAVFNTCRPYDEHAYVLVCVFYSGATSMRIQSIH